MCPVETVIHVIGRILVVTFDMLDNEIKVSLQIFAERVQCVLAIRFHQALSGRILFQEISAKDLALEDGVVVWAVVILGQLFRHGFLVELGLGVLEGPFLSSAKMDFWSFAKHTSSRGHLKSAKIKYVLLILVLILLFVFMRIPTNSYQISHDIIYIYMTNTSYEIILDYFIRIILLVLV